MRKLDFFIEPISNAFYRVYQNTFILSIRKIFILFFLASLFSTPLLKAQDFTSRINPTKDSREEIVHFFKKIDSNYNKEVISAYYDEIIEREKLWTGWGINSSYRYNNNTLGVGVDDDFFNYRQRMTVGVKLDLIKGGYSTKKVNIAKAELDKNKRLFKYENDEYTIAIKTKSLFIEQKYWQEMTFWFYLESLVEAEITKIDSLSLLGGAITDVEYLLSKERLNNSKKELEKYGYQTEYFLDFDGFLPQFDVDTSFLNQLDTLLAKNGNIIEQQQNYILEKNRTIHDVSLSPFLSYNIFDQINRVNSYFSVGVNFSMPISAFYKKNSDPEIEILTLDQELKDLNRYERVENILFQISKNNEDIKNYQDKIELLNIENTKKQGSYFSLKKLYFHRVMLIINYRRNICEEKKANFIMLITLMDICNSNDVIDFVNFL